MQLLRKTCFSLTPHRKVSFGAKCVCSSPKDALQKSDRFSVNFNEKNSLPEILTLFPFSMLFSNRKKDAILLSQRCIPPKQKESLNQHRIISMLIKGLPLFTNYICTLSWPKMHFILLPPALFLPHCFSAYVSLCASQVLLWRGHRWLHYHWDKAHHGSS